MIEAGISPGDLVLSGSSQKPWMAILLLPW